MPAALDHGFENEYMTTDARLVAHAIDPDRLRPIRKNKTDGYSNTLQVLAAAGQGEPLRCCLRYATLGEQIALISFAPFNHPSVWTEVGPVYIHALECDGYTSSGSLPPELSTGPCLLRTYRADDTMNYDHNTVINDRAELEPIIRKLLHNSDVATVHVRSLRPQCFLFAVTAEGTGESKTST